MYPGMCDLIDKFSSLCNVKEPSTNTKKDSTKSEKTGLPQTNNKENNSTRSPVFVDSGLVKNKGKNLQKYNKKYFLIKFHGNLYPIHSLFIKNTEEVFKV